LPLALDQAGAYIEETGCDLTGYLNLYQEYGMNLLKRQSRLSTSYAKTVASTWLLSFEQVERESLIAANILRLCAFLAPDIIPEDMFTANASFLHPELDTMNALTLNDAVEVLLRFSLVRRDPATKSLTIHCLVQVVIKDKMDDELQKQWAERTVCLVNTVFPQVMFATWSCCQQHLPHAFACADLIQEYALVLPEAVRLLDHTGWYLQERANYIQAESLMKRALALIEQVPSYRL
jgi:hypothetical protein